MINENEGVNILIQTPPISNFEETHARTTLKYRQFIRLRKQKILGIQSVTDSLSDLKKLHDLLPVWNQLNDTL